jgi:hypothetical protein
MKRIAVLLVPVLFCFMHAAAHKGQLDLSKLPTPSRHHQDEYTFDSPLHPAAWDAQTPGLHVSFASTDALYFRTEVPELAKHTLSWEATGWQGERVNAMILVWSPETLKQVRFVLSDLHNQQGDAIHKHHLRLYMVRYVVSDFPYGARELFCDESPTTQAYLMPDRFETFDRFDVPGKTVRPVWLSIDIPREKVAGTYTGVIEVHSEKDTAALTLTLTLQNQVLPQPSAWKYRLDLWQNPWVIAWKYNLEPWSDQHILLLREHLKLYVEAGGKYITTYAVHSPAVDNSYILEGAMIEWRKQKDGGWKFDYSIFDKYVQLALDAGIDKAITIYTPLPWEDRFRFLDEASGNYVYERWLPTSDTFQTNWHVFLTDLQKHLQQKGWLDITYLSFNENALEPTLAALKVIKGHSKNWRITYAGDWHKELDLLVDDYSLHHGRESRPEVVQQRAARGQHTTYYVSCIPAVPNTFVFSPPTEGRWISWYATAYGYDGFMRWAYDAWPADPARDARHVLWSAGDSYLVYPGGTSGIRFEKLREGIVDFEKIRILKEKAAGSTDKEVKNLVKELDDHLHTFLIEKDFTTTKMITDVEKGRKIVDRLSELVDDAL